MKVWDIKRVKKPIRKIYVRDLDREYFVVVLSNKLGAHWNEPRFNG